jgi:hypothetical protein
VNIWQCEKCGQTISRQPKERAGETCPGCRAGFHSGRRPESPLEAISSEEAWKRIASGESLENVWVTGALVLEGEFGKLRLSGALFETLTLRGVTAKSVAELVEVTVFSGFSIFGGKFKEGLLGGQSRFFGGIQMSGPAFGGFVDFESSEVRGEFYLGESQVTDELSLARAAVFGDITLDSTHIQQSLEATGLSAAGNVHIVGFGVQGWADISRTAIQGDLILDDSTFERGLDLQDSQVGGDLSLLGTRVGGDLFLARAHVPGTLQMRACALQGRADLRRTHLGEWGVYHTRFGQNFHARGLRCDGDWHLQSSSFLGGIRMEESRVGGDLAVEDLSLRGNWDMVGAEFGANVLLRASDFGGTLDLNRVQVAGQVDLEKCQPSRGFVFENARAGKWSIRLDQVRRGLFQEERGSWSRAALEWDLLESHFRTEKRSSDADFAHFKKRQMERRAHQEQTNPIKAFLEWAVMEWGSGYGMRPARVLGSALFLILAFAVLYFLSPESIILEGSEVAEVAGGIKSSFGDSLYFSIVTFTTLGYGDVHPSYLGWVKYAAAAEALLGAFVMALFAGTLARKIIRQ